MARRRRGFFRQLLRRTVPGALAGLLIGVPVSYSFQGSLVRVLLTRGQYTRKVYAAAPQQVWRQASAAASGQGGSSAGGIDPFRVIATLTTTLLVTASAGALINWRLTRP